MPLRERDVVCLKVHWELQWSYSGAIPFIHRATTTMVQTAIAMPAQLLCYVQIEPDRDAFKLRSNKQHERIFCWCCVYCGSIMVERTNGRICILRIAAKNWFAERNGFDIKWERRLLLFFFYDLRTDRRAVSDWNIKWYTLNQWCQSYPLFCCINQRILKCRPFFWVNWELVYLKRFRHIIHFRTPIIN